MAAIWVSSTRASTPPPRSADGPAGPTPRGQQAHPPQRFEPDRAHHEKFVGDRFQQEFGLRGEPGQLRLDPGGGDEFSRLVSQELLPCPPKTTA